MLSCTLLLRKVCIHIDLLCQSWLKRGFQIKYLAATLSLHKEVGQEPAWNLLAAGQCETLAWLNLVVSLSEPEGLNHPF